MNADFLYLGELVEEFFHQRRVGKAFSIIENNGITGREVWFQVEFASFLSQHSTEPEWWREWPVEFDGRIEKEHLFCRPDFIIRKKAGVKNPMPHWKLSSIPKQESVFQT